MTAGSGKREAWAIIAAGQIVDRYIPRPVGRRFELVDNLAAIMQLAQAGAVHAGADATESECPRCINGNGIYNGAPCSLCNGTGEISEASLLGEPDAPQLRAELYDALVRLGDYDKIAAIGLNTDPSGAHAQGGEADNE